MLEVSAAGLRGVGVHAAERDVGEEGLRVCSSTRSVPLPASSSSSAWHTGQRLVYLSFRPQ